MGVGGLMTNELLTTLAVNQCGVPLCDRPAMVCAEHFGSSNRIIADLRIEITQLRGNLSLAEEGLASAMQEIQTLRGPGNPTQMALDAVTKPLHIEIERLKAKRDEWYKAEAAWNWSVLQLLRQVAAGERRANEAQAILDGHRIIERPVDIGTV